VLERFGDPNVYARAEAEIGVSLTLNEVIALEFSSVRAPLSEVAAWLVERARIRPGFGELVSTHRTLVVSSGFHELIEPVLEREGIEVEVIANRLDPGPRGWRVRFRSEQPCAVCLEPCKRRDLPPGPLVYAGDGYSDLCAARAADRVFATGGLADDLQAEGIPFEPLGDFFQVAEALAREGSGRCP
jgi:2-hydroxy-3-keto-5-methylthiopentenyl-1-phosphate phosphatase